MEIDQVKFLLDKVDLTRLKYEKLDQLNASRFNLFSIFDIEEDEISHSKFISELLNPLGSHAQGNLFLSLFLTQLLPLNKELESTIDLKDCLTSAKSILNILLMKRSLRAVSTSILN